MSPPAFYASSDMPPPRAPPAHHSTATTKKKRHATLSRLERSQTLSTFSVPVPPPLPPPLSFFTFVRVVSVHLRGSAVFGVLCGPPYPGAFRAGPALT